MVDELFWFAMGLTACLAGSIAFLGVRRYVYIINPLLVFATFQIGILTLLSAVAANGYNGGQKTGLTLVLLFSMVYMVGFTLLYLPRRLSFPRKLFDILLRIVGRNTVSPGYGGLSQLILIMIALILFFLLMQGSGAGMLWITDPRQAYQSYRMGVGLNFVMVQWALLLSLVYYLWARKPRLVGVVFWVFVFSFAAYFTGSKASILSGVVVAGVYYYYCVRTIPTVLILSAPFLLIGVFLLLLLFQGSYSDFSSAISYFKDYTQTTATFLVRFDEFGLHWGSGMLSDLWFYVPRTLYPDKPFEYGVILIHKVLFPGAAAQGHTPGVLPWALSYLDFGVVGVFFSGLLSGFISRGAYESFLANRSNILAFILMIQLAILPVFIYATLPMIIVIAVFLALFMRKKIVFFASERQ